MMKRDDQSPGRMRSPHFESRNGSEAFGASEIGTDRDNRQLWAVPIMNVKSM